jgi:hypothetical protein
MGQGLIFESIGMERIPLQIILLVPIRLLDKGVGKVL